MVSPIPKEVEDGGSTMGSGMGDRNLYLSEGSRCPDCEERSEKDLL